MGPPMGWNSWDSYGLTINEEQLKANAAVLQKQLLPYGWRYVVLDEGWYFTNPEARQKPATLEYAMDEFGRFTPALNRFISADHKGSVRHDGQSLVYGGSPGLEDVGKWLHAHGMLFGIHIIRGVPKESVRMNLPIEGATYHAGDAADPTETCPWDPTSYGVKDNAAGQAWYDALLHQYAAWGIDFLKVDCISDHPYRASEIRQIHEAILHSGRQIVLSLSPGPTAVAHAEEVQRLSQMWRVSNDIWDVWKGKGGFPESIYSQFVRLAAWSDYTRPGAWPDADMLPFGELRPKPDVGPGPRRSRLTLDEERTQLTLWSFARSPLILGANLTLLDDATLGLLTNLALIRINQSATASRQILREDSLIVWSADLPGGSHAVAFFNTGDTLLHVEQPRHKVGLQAQRRLKNLWSGMIEPKSETLTTDIAPHSVVAVEEVER
jgi:alpha-galactosidase